MWVPNMNDNDVLRIIIGIIRTALGNMGDAFSTISVEQKYQPTQTGTPEPPAVFIHKVLTDRYGHPGRRSVFNTGNDNFDYEESIWRVPTFQISGLSQQDPASTTQLTASDIVETVADILQTEATRQTLLSSGIGITRITQVREAYFTNDKQRFEQSPSFDFVLSYRRTFNSTVPRVTRAVDTIRRV